MPISKTPNLLSLETPIVVSSGNSTTTPLSAGATFTGTAEEVLLFGQIHIVLFFRPNQIPSGDGSTAKGSFFFEFSRDASNWDISVPVLVRSGIFIPQTLVTVNRYFRVRYLNDGGVAAIAALGLTEAAGTPTTQTEFRLTTLYFVLGTKELGRTIDQSVSGSDPVTLSRSILSAREPSGSFTNIVADRFKRLRVANVSDVGVFGSAFVEDMHDDVSIAFDADVPANLVNTTTANGGTVTQSNAQAVLATSTATNGSASMSSRRIVHYRPGHEERIDFTAVFTSGVTGANQYIGIFDANNGFFIGYSGTTFQIVRRDNGTDNATARASWNGDPLDGSSSSEFTRSGVPEALDFTKSNVYRIRFGWLGNAPINFEVLSPDGFWVLMHQIKFPNQSTTTSIQNPDLPLTASVVKTSGATNITLKTSSWRGGAMGKVYVNRPSKTNKSTTVLSGGGVFTGVFEDCSGFSTIAVTVTTNQVSAADGVKVQFSDDGTTIRSSAIRTFTSSDVTAGNKVFFIPNRNNFFRLVYTNGGSAQGSFYLDAFLFENAPSLATDSIEGTLNVSSNASTVRAILAGKKPNGDYTNVLLNSSGSLIIADFASEVALGSISGYTAVHVDGSNPDIDTGSLPEDIWNNGGAYTFPDTAAVVSVVSTSILDNGVIPNTGARTLLIEGLDSSYNEISETITLNGVVPVLTTASFLRVQNATVKTAGALAANQGAITGLHVTPALTLFNLLAGGNVDRLGLYTVPNGKTALLKRMEIYIPRAAGGSAEVTLRTRLFGELFLNEAVLGGHSQGSSHSFRTFDPPKVLPAKTDLIMRVTDVSANNTPVACGLDLILANN